MSYKLNKTDGSLLIELVDGKIDTSSSNLTLVGKNYQGFGESINENFIKLLENFSNSTQPNKPLRGQLWYDTSEARLKIYDGTQFKSTDTTIYASTQPTNLTAGDIWINGSQDQLYFYNGTETVLVGPSYTKTQLKSGNFVETVKDSTGQNKVVIKLYINGAVVGIYAKEAFTPFPTITGFTTLKTGFNISSAFTDYKFLGTATNAENLIDSSGTVYDPLTLFLRKDLTTGDTTTGRIVINNDNGLLIDGTSSELNLITSGSTSVIRNNVSNSDLYINLSDGSTYNAMVFDASTRRIGINNASPDYTLDVSGSMRITGDFLVEGNTTSLDVSTLRVEDHQIELAISDDSTLLTDLQVDQAGIIVKASGDDKYILWQNDTKYWDISNGINIVDDIAGYNIDDVEVINKTTLGSSIVNSSLTSVGTLGELQVDNITIDGNRITSANTLEISAVGTVDFLNTPKLTNVATPVSRRISDLNAGTPAEDDDDFVATKGYVDSELAATAKVLSLDVTGLGTTYASGDTTLQNNVEIILDEIAPVSLDGSTIDTPDGTYARIHAYYYTAVTGAIDVNSNISKSFIAVDSAGVQNESVVQDFSISSPTASVSLTVNRITMVFVTQSNNWVWQSTAASAV